MLSVRVLLARCDFAMLNKHYQLVDQFLTPATDAIIVAIVIAYIWRVIRYKPGR